MHYLTCGQGHIIKCPVTLYHLTYVPVKFEVTTSYCLGSNASTRKMLFDLRQPLFDHNEYDQYKTKRLVV